MKGKKFVAGVLMELAPPQALLSVSGGGGADYSNTNRSLPEFATLCANRSAGGSLR